MDRMFEGIKKAFWLLVSFDPEVLGITLLSIKVSGTATLMSLILGISVGAGVTLCRANCVFRFFLLETPPCSPCTLP